MLPIKVRSIYTICQSVLRIKDIVKQAKDSGLDYCCLCDINSLAGSYEFYKECNKNGIKPVIGCEITTENSSLVLFAKNRNGWLRLCKLLSIANGRFDNKPILKFSDLDREKDIIAVVEEDIDIPVETVKMKLEDVRYFTEEDYQDLKLIICSNNNLSLPKTQKKIDNNELFLNSEFFTNKYDFKGFSGKPDFINSIESFKFEQDPILPKCYDGDESKILRQRCREGWKRMKTNMWGDEYSERIKYELDIFTKFNLAGYFLIIEDLVNYGKKNGWLTMARGSVGGSLVAHVLGISIADPIKHKLLLSRFVNPARLGADGSQASLPDIDVDVQPEHREDFINYLKNKYGNERISQIITFSRLGGSGALKEVLRMHEACDSYTSNLITKNMPKEAKIAGKMNEDGETSIIMWTLKHQPNIFKDYCQYKDGEFIGEYSEYFKQAIRIEGCIKSTSKHAAGVLISNKPLSETVPMVYDPISNNLISGMEFVDIDDTGIAVKLDVLGVSALTKLQNVNKLLRTGRI
jgi:DNA polymerase-3 subunit alpha